MQTLMWARSNCMHQVAHHEMVFPCCRFNDSIYEVTYTQSELLHGNPLFLQDLDLPGIAVGDSDDTHEVLYSPLGEAL